MLAQPVQPSTTQASLRAREPAPALGLASPAPNEWLTIKNSYWQVIDNHYWLSTASFRGLVFHQCFSGMIRSDNHEWLTMVDEWFSMVRTFIATVVITRSSINIVFPAACLSRDFVCQGVMLPCHHRPNLPRHCCLASRDLKFWGFIRPSQDKSLGMMGMGKGMFGKGMDEKPPMGEALGCRAAVTTMVLH